MMLNMTHVNTLLQYTILMYFSFSFALQLIIFLHVKKITSQLWSTCDYEGFFLLFLRSFIPSSSSAYLGPGHGASIFSREGQTALSFDTSISSSGKDAEAFPDQTRNVIFSVCSGYATASPPYRTCPKDVLEASWPGAQTASSGSS